MTAEFLQFLFSGLTVGVVYALAALGFNLVYNASHVINFAEGEFIMLGGMLSVFFNGLGLHWGVAFVLAILCTALIGVILVKFTIEPARNADVIGLIIITIGASLVIRGLVEIWLGKNPYTMPAFTSHPPLELLGARLQAQSLWVFGVTGVVMVALWYFFRHTLLGKGMLATSYNRTAALLVGINTRWILVLSFALSGALGALAGILITPITLTSYDVGVMLTLKGFVAAVLGGMGSNFGAVVGGLLVGVLEAMGAGYISSAYKDAIPFILILLILFFMPRGLFGGKSTDRV